MSTVYTSDLLEHFNLTLVAGKEGINRPITTSEISRPGIELAGCFDFFQKERLQMIGQTEMAYYMQLSPKEKIHRTMNLCTEVTPGIIVSRGMDVPEEFIQAANECHVPILQSDQSTTYMMSQITDFLKPHFMPSIAVHGVLVDIYGVGVLIKGKSGIGKSEIALELVKRGHRLVADDRVEIRQMDGKRLIGSSPPLIKHLIEIRGLGIIDVKLLFGAHSVLNQKEISFIINLEIWDEKKEYDRLGIDETTATIMDVVLPEATIPIRPGIHIPVIIEVAAMNFRLKKLGVNAAQEFTERLQRVINSEQDAGGLASDM